MFIESMCYLIIWVCQIFYNISITYNSTRRYRTTLDGEMPSSPDTHRLQLTRLTLMDWNMVSELIILALSGLDWSYNFLQLEHNSLNTINIDCCNVINLPFASRLILIAYAVLRPSLKYWYYATPSFCANSNSLTLWMLYIFLQLINMFFFCCLFNDISTFVGYLMPKSFS